MTEHALVARICPVCQRRRLPKEALQGVVLGQQRLGVNLVPDGDPAGGGTCP